MALNFVQYINANTNLTTEQKVKLLDDFVYSHNYTDTVIDANGNQVQNPVTKTQYFNKLVSQFILGGIVRINSRTASLTTANEIRSTYETELGA
jgi:hypothetical protein